MSGDMRAESPGTISFHSPSSPRMQAVIAPVPQMDSRCTESMDSSETTGIGGSWCPATQVPRLSLNGWSAVEAQPGTGSTDTKGAKLSGQYVARPWLWGWGCGVALPGPGDPDALCCGCLLLQRPL